MNYAYITFIADLGSYYARNAFRGITDYVRPFSDKFAVVAQNRLLWKGRKPAGIIAMTNSSNQKKLRDTRLKVVNISSIMAESGFPSVISDAREVGRLAALHLLAAGFDHFGFYGAKGVGFHGWRCQGFIQELQAQGKQCAIYFDRENLNYRQLLGENKPLKQWIARLSKPVGILCGSDWAAQIIYDACQERSLKIPFDVALVGIDNDEMRCETYAPPLSSVDTDARRIGYEAAALLFRLLDGKSAPTRPTLIKPPGVIQRRSSDVFICNDPHISTVVRYIRQHIEERLQVRQLLQLVPLSRRVLEHRFYQGLGWTMQTEIHRCKIERIKQCLANTNWSMEKLATRMGFSNPNHMSSMFRRETGMTLSNYRINSRH